MTCCVEIPTPQSILDDDARDVFEEIFPNTETYCTEMRTIMWAFYRYRGIGNCDVSYWVQNMKDRYAQIKSMYTAKFKAFDEWLSANTGTSPVDLSDSSGESTTRTSYGHVITSSIGQKKNTSVFASKKNVTEHEDNPDNPQGNTKYLSSRDTLDEGSHTDTSTDDPSTDSDTHSGMDTVSFNSKTYSGLSSETLSKFMESIPDLHRQFAGEFRKQFYFGL